MAKFCTNCGKPVTDDITKICSNCGADLTQPVPPTNQKDTAMDQQELIGRAVPFFTSKSYTLQTQTDYVVTFESQSREVNWLIVLVLCCLGIIPAAIYYYFFTQKHHVTLSLSGTTGIRLAAIGNTEQAKKDAAEFMQSLI